MCRLKKRLDDIEALVKKIERSREFTKVRVDLGVEVEFQIPSSLSPNFILEEGRYTSFYLSAEHLPVIKEER